MISGKLYRYSIDKVNGRFVSGWCYHRFFKKKPLTLRLMADNQVLGTVKNNFYRKDLKKEELHPTGLCGFNFNFPDDFIFHNCHYLHMHIDNQRAPLVSIPCRDIELLRPDSSKNVFFMHIPKTAGSSFNAFLRLCYPASRYSSHIERLEQREWHKLFGAEKCISGHLPWYKIGELVKDQGYELFAIIREPLGHLHSHFNYVRRVQTDVEHEVHYDHRHNDTIRALAGKLNKVNFSDNNEIRKLVASFKDYELDFFDNIQTRYFLDYRPDKVTVKDLENARENIDRFRCIGLTEHYNMFLDRFCDYMQLPSQTQVERSNESDSYRLFDPADISTRSTLNQLVDVDLLLYQYITQKFWPGKA